MQDTLGIAAQLLQAGRAYEALDWVRKPGHRRFGDGDVSPVRASLEARILEALDDKPAAQALQWGCFPAQSKPDWAYLRGLGSYFAARAAVFMLVTCVPSSLHA